MHADEPLPDPDLTPEDAARVHRWEACGCPPIPLFADAHGVVATTTNLRTVLRGRTPATTSYRHAAARWVDRHCPDPGDAP